MTSGELLAKRKSCPSGDGGGCLAILSWRREFTTQLFPAQASLLPDLVLHVYAGTTPAPAGESFLLHNIEVFETSLLENASIMRASPPLKSLRATTG